MRPEEFMQMAVNAAFESMWNNVGGPFGCLIVSNGKIISTGCNEVTSTNDPTAHAEIVAIRQACKKLNSFQLTGCELYTTCEPCPMCLGAIYWARPDKVYYACTAEDAAKTGFDDSFIYKEINVPHAHRRIPFEQIGRLKAKELFRSWSLKEDKIKY